jgi:outer membrane autotransporter protein
MAGPWWVGASTLYDSLDNNYTIDRVGFAGKFGSSVWGTQIDGGYTVDWRFGSIEPYAALTYLSARYDGLTTPWGNFDFGNPDSIDGKLGARARIPVWANEGWAATMLGNLSITHEFRDTGIVTFDGFAIPNNKVANWGDLGGGAEIGTRDSHFSGYVKADWLAASGLNGYSVLGGLDYRW